MCNIKPSPQALLTVDSMGLTLSCFRSFHMAISSFDLLLSQVRRHWGRIIICLKKWLSRAQKRHSHLDQNQNEMPVGSCL